MQRACTRRKARAKTRSYAPLMPTRILAARFRRMRVRATSAEASRSWFGLSGPRRREALARAAGEQLATHPQRRCRCGLPSRPRCACRGTGIPSGRCSCQPEVPRARPAALDANFTPHCNKECQKQVRAPRAGLEGRHGGVGELGPDAASGRLRRVELHGGVHLQGCFGRDARARSQCEDLRWLEAALEKRTKRGASAQRLLPPVDAPLEEYVQAHRVPDYASENRMAPQRTFRRVFRVLRGRRRTTRRRAALSPCRRAAPRAVAAAGGSHAQ